MQESLSELFWNPAARDSLPKLLISLAIAALLGLVLGKFYVRFGQSLSNRAGFARNFLLLTVTTTLIISIVKSSLALSLGLVGALSIVRFRAAIKEPEELAFLFLAISIGLGLGAGQALVTVAALAVILGIVALRSAAKPAADTPNLYLTVASPAAAKMGAGQILEALNAVGARATLRRLDETADQVEAAFTVHFKGVGALEQFTTRIREISPGVRVSCLDDRGMGA
jgi:hypothetical protein